MRGGEALNRPYIETLKVRDYMHDITSANSNDDTSLACNLTELDIGFIAVYYTRLFTNF